MNPIDRSQKGFTLVEIIITLIVIMALALIAIPKFGSILEKFRAQEGKTALYSVMGAAMRYRADHSKCEPTNTLNNLDVNSLRLSANFQTPTISWTCPAGGCGGLVAGNGPQCLPKVDIVRTGAGGYTLTLDATDQLVTCTGSTMCPRVL